MFLAHHIYKTVLVLFLSTMSFVCYGQCADDINYWADSWTSCNISANPNSLLSDSHWILYEFEEPIEIVGTHIWNANKSGESGRGISEVLFHVSYDGLTWNQINNDVLNWPQAPESNTYPGFEGPALNEYGLVTKVLLTVQSTFDNSSCCSLAEIRFDVNPLACDGIIDECDVCNGPGKYTYYLDADNDGLGNPASFVQACKFPPNGYVTNNADDCDTGGWQQMGILFENNGCTGCHNSTSPSGLNLLSYAGFLTGGNKCDIELQSGRTLVDIITVEGYSACGTPIQGLSMNDRVGGLLDDYELKQIQAWVDAGVPEFDCQLCDQVGEELKGTECDDADLCTERSYYVNNCECLPRTNLALTGTASMSSILNSSFDETYLNDDDLVNGLSETSDASNHEWMQIELTQLEHIHEVVITNRIDCCLDRLNNVYILISDTAFPANTDLEESRLHATYSAQLGDVAGQHTVMIPVGQQGRYVRIQKSGDNGSSNILNIKELQIMGDFVFLDADNDSICDMQDLCPGLDDGLIGQSCDDGNICTSGETYDGDCHCSGGIFQDEDNDGVCDANDICQDGDDNIDSDNDGIPDDCDADCVLLITDDFETNNTSNWTSGGSDAALVQSANSPAGNYSYRIRDNSFEKSAITSSMLDLSSTDILKLQFDFKSLGFDDGEDFFLEISTDGGITYAIYKVWVAGTDFISNQIYNEIIDISSQHISATTHIRFRSDASINADEVYLDNIQLESCEYCNDHILELSQTEIVNDQSAGFSIQSNGIVKSGSNVSYTAGESIELIEGFEIENASTFHAFIQFCN